jgi:hypothetical protein
MDPRIGFYTGNGSREIQTLGHKIIRPEILSAVCSALPTEHSPVGHASESSLSTNLDKTFVIDAANILQALICLSDLMNADAEDPGKVRVYANLAKENLMALGELMRPMLWKPGALNA